jgi:hypothetical protein
MHMSNEPLLLTRPEDSPDEDDYRAFCAALEASGRGRGFLAEYARRNRQADTAVLLAALDRIEARLTADGAALARLRDELRLLVAAIRVTRAGSERGNAVKLAGLLELLERRMEGLLVDAPQAAIASPLAAPLPAAKQAAPEAARAPLSLVPPAEEPELPIPSPAAQPPAIALVQHVQAAATLAMEKLEAAVATAPLLAAQSPAVEAKAPEAPVAAEDPGEALLPAVTLFGAGASQAPAATPKPFEEIAFARKSDAPPRPAAPAKPKPDAMTALMAIMALSEEERLALFT